MITNGRCAKRICRTIPLTSRPHLSIAAPLSEDAQGDRGMRKAIAKARTTRLLVYL